MKILVIGGTTEGRQAAGVLDEAGSDFLYSTLTGKQQVDMCHGQAISGALTAADVARMQVDLIVDAAHPYALEAHKMAVEGGRLGGAAVVRYERQPLPRDPRITYCADYDAAIDAMNADGVERLLALSGVHTVSRLQRWWHAHSDTYFRVLDRDESRAEVAESGFPLDRLCYYTGSEDDTPALLDRLHPDAVITKDSGRSGGFEEKTAAALERGIRVYVVDRQPLPTGYAATVYGPVGLRRAVQSLLPDFFKLRSGLTTGTTATAAARAAMQALVGHGGDDATVTVVLPSGEPIEMAVAGCRRLDDKRSRATVVKDGGDDPDVTTGLEIAADVVLTDDAGAIAIEGGEGIGRVTLPGLGLPVGEAAINPVPRRMIADNLRPLLPEGRGATVTISVEGGSEIAVRTFNPRLGVVGGISIIGTSGVVRPFSNEAFIESLRRQFNVAIAAGCRCVVLNSGAKSEHELRAACPDIPDAGFIHYGNLVGEAVKAAAQAGVDEIVVGIMIGKLVKLAAGSLDTHSSGVVMSHTFLLEVGREVGLEQRSLDAIPTIKLARELWTLLADDPASRRFYDALISRARALLQPLATPADLRLILIP